MKSFDEIAKACRSHGLGGHGRECLCVKELETLHRALAPGVSTILSKLAAAGLAVRHPIDGEWYLTAEGEGIIRSRTRFSP
jgi:hypothetical protein